MIRVLLFGDFWNRQPLAYPAIRDRLSDRIDFVDDPAEAQIALFSHTHDLTRHGQAMIHLLAAHPGLRAVLLSEEPFWDTCWAPDPFSRFQTWQDGPVSFGYAVLNHFTSDIFDTQTIPYFLLTDPRYIAHYRPLFDRNAGFAATDWQSVWRDAAWDAAFLAERRDAARHDPKFPEREVWGLSVLRSRIARHCRGAAVLRAGQGWDEQPPRTELPDWHADKLARLDLKCRYISAIENTHQSNYLTEKLYDAFAAGGFPLYFAAKGHQALRAVQPGSWVNLDARLPRKDAEKPRPLDATVAITDEQTSAYMASQNRLARLFADAAAVQTELDRLADRLSRALQSLVR